MQFLYPKGQTSSPSPTPRCAAATFFQPLSHIITQRRQGGGGGLDCDPFFYLMLNESVTLILGTDLYMVPIV